MPILRFRIYFEEDETIHRDVLIKHSQNFFELHEAILKSFEFDSKHQATFYRSNDNWLRGREISLTVYEKNYIAPPLIMSETLLGSEIKDTNQRFVYVYDFSKNWVFLIELISVAKEENNLQSYPQIIRIEQIGPSQYSTKSMLNKKFADIEEKYDLSANTDGFSKKDELGQDVTEAEPPITE